MTAIPMAAMKSRDDLSSYCTIDHNSILKLSVVYGVESMVNYYTDLSDSQLASVVSMWEGDTLLHLASRNQ